MAEFLKSQSPQELWKASLKPKDLLQPDKSSEVADKSAPPAAAKTPGTGLLLDTMA
jgi:hypothetical protein